VKQLLKHDYVMMTKAGLEGLEMVLESRKDNLFRSRKVPRP